MAAANNENLAGQLSGEGDDEPRPTSVFKRTKVGALEAGDGRSCSVVHSGRPLPCLRGWPGARRLLASRLLG
jgi:hypothetical protein